MLHEITKDELIQKNRRGGGRITFGTSSGRGDNDDDDEEDDDGNLDGDTADPSLNSLAKDDFALLQTSVATMTRDALSSGTLSIGLQILAGTYVALETSVLSFAMASATKSDRPSSSMLASLGLHIDTSPNVSGGNQTNDAVSSSSGGGSGGGGGGGGNGSPTKGGGRGGGARGDSASASSVVEETFALLQHAMTRAMRSGMLDLACAAVNVSVVRGNILLLLLFSNMIIPES